MRQMNVLLIATEAAPSSRFPKTGVLGDVVFGLAKELCDQGHDARIAIPCYRGTPDRSSFSKLLPELSISLGAYDRQAIVWKAPGIPPVYLIDDNHEFYFGRDDLYGYLDDYERFIFFTRATIEMLRSADFSRSEDGWFPDIIQGYDWASGMIPGWLRQYQEEFKATRFVLSIQNIGRPGIYGSRALGVAGLKADGVYGIIGENAERISFLGRGILGADKVVTVNPDYGPANPLPDAASDLRAILTERGKEGNLVGIRSGIDYDQYNPSTDMFLPRPFRDVTRDRAENKRMLQTELDLELDISIPLLGAITRLTHAKGVDLLPRLGKLPREERVQLVIMANPGEMYYQDMIERWETQIRERHSTDGISLKIIYGFDEKLARRIYAASDIILMPSRLEPASIQQYIAMHYGAVPVVHCTGVLASAVVPYRPDEEIRRYTTLDTGVGFVFGNGQRAEPDPEAFLQTVREAIQVYRTNSAAWKAIRVHNMPRQFLLETASRSASKPL